MAKHILRLEEFECADMWHCAATAEIGKIGNKWYTLPFALKMSAYDFVKLLVEKYQPDSLSLREGPYGSVLIYAWKSQAKMRVFKNWMNAQLRKAQFFVE
jgi:hypothetical protein